MGKFIIKDVPSGVKFDLQLAGGKVIATSEVYSSLDAVKNGIESVKSIGRDAFLEDQTLDPVEEMKHPKFELYQDKAGEYRFRLKARNGQVVIFSSSYLEKDGCLSDIKHVRGFENSQTEKV